MPAEPAVYPGGRHYYGLSGSQPHFEHLERTAKGGMARDA